MYKRLNCKNEKIISKLSICCVYNVYIEIVKLIDYRLKYNLITLFILFVTYVYRSPVPALGLSLVVGLVLYISSINDEMLNRTKNNEAYFSYKYGWSFAFAAISFLLTEVTPLTVHRLGPRS